ncbi:hypothetical protein TIFTF001_017360 [Ficus carica]|uniref:Uncharacterized protein n=1 Tax=Ficus carica TaxID=3494 RepID=A0AA88D6X7_FICCA|nr:hypothetical protein TIFTF001_017360 [Ficus carica]
MNTINIDYKILALYENHTDACHNLEENDRTRLEGGDHCTDHWITEASSDPRPLEARRYD